MSVIVQMEAGGGGSTVNFNYKDHKTADTICCLAMVGLLISGSICIGVANRNCPDAAQGCDALRATGQALLITWGVLSSLICCCVCCAVCGVGAFFAASG
ncbi:MAG: hypothetical protein KR126chlam2_00263 [Chlamydiae bacterium]|nr:hypothetical protein [Chlamydiota bacterium]